MTESQLTLAQLNRQLLQQRAYFMEALEQDRLHVQQLQRQLGLVQQRLHRLEQPSSPEKRKATGPPIVCHTASTTTSV